MPLHVYTYSEYTVYIITHTHTYTHSSLLIELLHLTAYKQYFRVSKIDYLLEIQW